MFHGVASRQEIRDRTPGIQRPGRSAPRTSSCTSSVRPVLLPRIVTEDAVVGGRVGPYEDQLVFMLLDFLRCWRHFFERPVTLRSTA